MTQRTAIIAIVLSLLMTFSQGSWAKFIPPTYPDILKDENWKQSKSGWAKLITGKSGIKSAMTSAEKAFGKVDWNKMIIPPMRMVKVGGIPKIDEYYEEAKKEYKSNVTKLREKVKKIEEAAEAEIKKREKDKTLKEYVAHVKEVKQAADLFAVSLQGNSSNFDEMHKDFEQLRQRWQAQFDKIKADAMANIAATVKKARTFIDEVENAPTADNFNNGITTAARDIAQNITNITKFKTWEKSDPKDLATRIDPWANSKVSIGADEDNPDNVKKVLKDFADLVDAIEAWAASEA